MKRMISAWLLVCICLLWGCTAQNNSGQIVATTMPVYCFTKALCQNTDLTVTRLVTENVSCLHDYTLQVWQMQAAEQAELVILSGVGLEEFLEDVLVDKPYLDASHGVALLEGGHHHHEDETEEEHESYGQDPHIWLSPKNAKVMASNICRGLCEKYPQYTSSFEANLASLHKDLDELQAYGEENLAGLSRRELITFHDGFGYLAHSFDLTILEAVEEESGSEASAKELIHMVNLVREHDLPAIFTERSGSVSAASVIAAETGVRIFTLDMAMTGDNYFEAMYRNIDTLKEALQ